MLVALLLYHKWVPFKINKEGVKLMEESRRKWLG
jgi:hypothetical protein